MNIEYKITEEASRMNAGLPIRQDLFELLITELASAGVVLSSSFAVQSMLSSASLSSAATSATINSASSNVSSSTASIA